MLLAAYKQSYTPNTAELDFIRKSYKDCVAFLTICGGVIPACLAGVLNGKSATGPRVALDILRKMSPETTWLDKRYVQDGKIWTSGALLNGLDMMRAFVTSVWGYEGTGEIAQVLLKLGHYPIRDIDYKDAPEGPF